MDCSIGPDEVGADCDLFVSIAAESNAYNTMYQAVTDFLRRLRTFDKRGTIVATRIRVAQRLWPYRPRRCEMLFDRLLSAIVRFGLIAIVIGYLINKL